MMNKIKTKKTTLAEIEIRYKSNAFNFKINNSEDAYRVFTQIWDNSLLNILEQFYALFIAQNKQLLGWRLLGTGTGNQCLVDIPLLAGIACKSLSKSVVIAHNHPSGELKPSKIDKYETDRVSHALSFFNMALDDHLIISGKGYYSFLDNSILNS